jgi:hypothetical protein
MRTDVPTLVINLLILICGKVGFAIVFPHLRMLFKMYLLRVGRVSVAIRGLVYFS